MSTSLRDQLTQLGFKAPAIEPPASRERPRGPSGRPERKDERRPHERSAAGKGAPSPRPQDGKAAGKPRTSPGSRPAPHAERGPRRSGRGSEMDLGKAYALRAQKEKDERIEAERQKQEAARLRREARARLAEYLRDKALNAADAELTRHFEYGGKIKRVHVTAEQLKALNAGELGVVQNEGRYLLVTAAVLAEAQQLFAPAIALKVDPDAPAEADPYSDPKYQVPDDLVW